MGNVLFSVTTFEKGSALYQSRRDKPKLITYASRYIPEVAKKIFRELKLCGLAINIAS